MSAQSKPNFYDIPEDIDAEQSTLSCLLLEGEAQGARLDSAADVLVPEDFSRLEHQRVYAAMLAIREQGNALDLVVLKNELIRRSWLEEAGGTSYLMALCDFMATPANLSAYLATLQQLSHRRRFLSAAAQIRGAALNPEITPEDVAVQAENLIHGATDNAPNKGPVWTSAGEASGKYLLRLIDRAKSGNVGLSGIPTGIHSVDAMLGGLEPKTLNLIAGRPSMGKSAAAFTVARNIAGLGKVGGVFLLEGSTEIVMSRLLSQISGVNSRKLQQAKLSTEERERLSEAHKYLLTLPLEFDDSSNLTVGDIRSRLRRLRSRHGALDFAVVDYLQIMRGDTKRSQGDKRIEVLEIAQGLKSIAKEFEIPVIAVAQLNRGVERREDKRPMMSDLGESGQIEQEADTISFLYRPSYYAAKGEEDVRPATEIDEAEWIVAKNKEGSQGLVKVGFIPAFTQFVDIDFRHGNGEVNRGF